MKLSLRILFIFFRLSHFILIFKNLCYNINMADYIFIRKSRNALSSLTHVILNLLLATVSIGATVITHNPTIGLILVLASKWRVFAVNHRYWWLNIRSSLVDLIVGVSFVLLAFFADDRTFLPVHFVLMAAYAIWLIILKPRSSPTFAIIQALVAVLVGTTTASIFAAISESWTLVLAEFVIGFAAAHHVLIQSAEQDYALMALTCGLFFAEIAWLSHAWLIIYTIGTTGLCVSQLALVLTILSFAFFRIYSAITEHGNKLKFKDVALPVIFSLVVIIVLLISFSQPRFNIH